MSLLQAAVSFDAYGPKQLHVLAFGYTSSRKFRDMIAAFMRKTIEPFVIAVKNYLEISLIDCPEVESGPVQQSQEKTFSCPIVKKIRMLLTCWKRV